MDDHLRSIVTIIQTQTPCNKEWNGVEMKHSSPIGDAWGYNIEIHSLDQLRDLLTETSNHTNRVLMSTGYFHDQPLNTQFRIMSASKMKSAHGIDNPTGIQTINNEQYVARITENTSSNNIMLADIDPSSDMPERFVNFTIPEWVQFIRDVSGQNVGCVVTKSTSSRTGGKGGIHIYMMIKDPSDARRFKKAWIDRGFLNGWSFMKKTVTGAGRISTVFDPSVLANHSRIDFTGKPYVPENAVNAPVVTEAEVLLFEGDEFDTTSIKDVEGDEASQVIMSLASVGLERSGDGFKCDTGLTLDTVVEVRARNSYETWETTVREFWLSDHENLRCQIPAEIRETSSWNGILGKSDSPYLHDNGTGITYKLNSNDVQAMKVSMLFPVTPQPSFMQPVVTVVQPSFMQPVTQPNSIEGLVDELRYMDVGSPKQREHAAKLMKLAETCGAVDRVHWQTVIKDIMLWSTDQMKAVIKASKTDSTDLSELFKQFIFVKGKNMFYEFRTNNFYKVDQFSNAYLEYSDDIRKIALIDGVEKVDNVDFAPCKPRTFTIGDVEYGNTWSQILEVGAKGDVSRWLNHWDVLGWSKHRDHMLKWMAFTMRHPDVKINHAIMLGGGEGVGKDWMLEPLRIFMGNQHKTIEGNKLASDFNEYLFRCKLLIINETDMGGHKDALMVNNAIKPLCSNPPDTLSVNIKNMSETHIRNIVNVAMTTNSDHPLYLTEMSRRIFAVQTSLRVRDSSGEMTPEWVSYWDDLWSWMRSGGAAACIHYLLNDVDLSDFDAGKAPPVTEFLTSICDNSKHTMQLTLENLIEHRTGGFAKDLMTVGDMVAALKACTFAGDDVQRLINVDKINEQLVGRHIGKTSAMKVLGRTRTSGVEVKYRLWVLREFDKYAAMSSKQLADLYLSA